MNQFNVSIIEILKRTVKIKADSREEAEDIIRRQWKNGEYILGADDFDRVLISTKQEGHTVSK